MLKRQPDHTLDQLLDRKKHGDRGKGQLAWTTRRLQRQRAEPEEDRTCRKTRGGGETHSVRTHETAIAGGAETVLPGVATENIPSAPTTSIASLAFGG